MEEFYKHFQKGNDLQSIAENVIEIYHNVKFNHTWHIHTIKDFEQMRSKIVYKIIHAKKNEELLKRLPHVAYLDFAIVFYILFEIDESGTATIPITHELIQLWDVTPDEIRQNAFQNAPTLLPATFKSMQVVIDELMGTHIKETECAVDIMYILTNSILNFGAACILYEGMLEMIYDQLGENYYVLPSSIHEVIIVPESNISSREHLNDLLKEVNETQVDVEEVLSDCVYYYDAETNTLS